MPSLFEKQGCKHVFRCRRRPS